MLERSYTAKRALRGQVQFRNGRWDYGLCVLNYVTDHY